MGDLIVEGRLRLRALVGEHLLFIEAGEQRLHERGEIGGLLPHGGEELPRLNGRLGGRRVTCPERIEPRVGFRALHRSESHLPRWMLPIRPRE